MAKQDETKKPDTQKQTFLIPTQKTFMFNVETNQHEIDQEVNQFLRKRAIEGKTPPMFGKVFSDNSVIYIVYLYLEKTEIEIPADRSGLN